VKRIILHEIHPVPMTDTTKSPPSFNSQPQQKLLPPPRRRSRKMMWIVGGAMLAGGIGWLVYSHTSAPQKNSRHDLTVPVTLATINKGDIDVIDPALGTVTPLANVTVRTQINGQLQEVAFKEGQIVHQGDFLAQIDPRPYQMTLEQAVGALQRDHALLKEAEIDLARYQKLAQQDSISKQQVDQQASLVEQYRGATITDQGQIDASNLNIAYCHITAPVTGRVGLRQVDPGNYAQTSDTNGLVTLTQLDPISVIFTLPEDQLPAVMKRLSQGAELQVTASDRTESTKLATGKLTAVDNQIDTTTGTVKARAQFDNPENQLYPNQFVNIQVLVDTLHDTVVAPQAAVLRGSPGTFVYLANADHTVTMRPVKLGVAQGDNVQITDGLQPGDKVVTDGTDKLSDGAKYTLPGQQGQKSGGKSGSHHHKDKADAAAQSQSEDQSQEQSSGNASQSNPNNAQSGGAQGGTSGSGQTSGQSAGTP
jgi:multidrug efflux system membrane fusion protein